MSEEGKNASQMNKDILTQAFEKMRAHMLAKARSIVISDDEAKDVIQESFCRLWGRHQEIIKTAQAEGLLMTTVRNLSIDRLRRLETHPTRPLDDTAGIAAEDEDADNSRNDIMAAVDSIVRKHLSERDREILLRRDRDGWDFEELAEKFDMTPGAVRTALARARKTVREIYLNRKQ